MAQPIHQVLWGIGVACLVAFLPDPADARETDATPGCVDRREYHAAVMVDAKAHVDRRLGSHGHPAMFSGERDFQTGLKYVNHSPFYVKYVYPGCTGHMYVIYELPNEYHPKTREWVQMRYRDYDFPVRINH